LQYLLVQREEFDYLERGQYLVVHLGLVNFQGRKVEVIEGEDLFATEIFQGNTGAGRQNQQFHTLKCIFRKMGAPESFLQQLIQRRTAVSRYILFMYQGIVRGIKDRQRKSIREKSDG
jgi:hypothetical protein